MSRSLRTRPLTLYDAGESSQTHSQQHGFGVAGTSDGRGQGRQAGPPVVLTRRSSRRQQAQMQLQQAYPASSAQDASAFSSAAAGGGGGSGSGDGSAPGSKRMSKAIGNNLRKRLSMRYAEPTALGPGGLSAVPAMPALPSQYSAGGGSASQDGLGPGVDAGMAGIGLRAGRGIPPSGSMADNLAIPPSADPLSSNASLGYGFQGTPSTQPLDGSAMGYAQGDSTLQYQQHQALHEQHQQMDEQGHLARRDADGARRGGWERLERFARNPAVDLNLLTQSKFDPEAYLRATLNNHSEEGLREFQSTLESTSAAANSDLRRIIFKNYKDFINISKEVSTLENDMLELKELLTEWRQLPEALQIVDSKTNLDKLRKGSRGDAVNAGGDVGKASGGGPSTSRSAGNSPAHMQITQLTDDLAVKIALREWEEAADLVERGKETLKTLPQSDPALIDLSSKLSRRVTELIAAVSLSLSSPLNKKSTVVSYASIMQRLGQGEKARELFLEARTELLRKRTRMIKFEGDVGLYISELALVYFTLVKNTSEMYMSAFKDNWMASGYVKWAAVQIQAYAEIFRRQVYGVADQDQRVVSEALEITRSSSAQLKEVGLDFGFLIEELLRPAGMERPIPSLTLTLADDTFSSAHGHRSSYISTASSGGPSAPTSRPTGTLISAQERRKTIMLQAGSGGAIPGIPPSR